MFNIEFDPKTSLAFKLAILFRVMGKQLESHLHFTDVLLRKSGLKVANNPFFEEIEPFTVD